MQLNFIFTLDYEIYGNGLGAVKDLVVDPTETLAALLRRFGAPFVNFVEVSEFLQLEWHGADAAVGELRDQLRRLREAGHEIALHLHPQWSNARYADGRWDLDYGEYNLCTLPQARIESIVDGALGWLREVLGDPGFVPCAFRAGNWLFQPTARLAEVLSERGVQIDSSVFKGGRIHAFGLDYRAACAHGQAWRFSTDVARIDPAGAMVEVPIHTELVPWWSMIRAKRLGLQRKVPGSGRTPAKAGRWRDLFRWRYPRKLDFCRMTFEEMRGVVDRVAGDRNWSPREPRFVVAIGHSKDLVDLDAIERLLVHLAEIGARVTTFERVLPQLWACTQSDSGAGEALGRPRTVQSQVAARA